MKTGPKRKPLEERFWRFVDKSGGPTACWPWQGARLAKGYGCFARGGDSKGLSPLKAHRVAWALTNDVDPLAMLRTDVVRHRCDNPPCCNPAHLSIGTHKDNQADSIALGRANWQRGIRDNAGKFRRTK